VPDASQLPRQSKPISDVVVPIPREVFGTLDKFANSNWRTVQRSALGHAKAKGDQTQIALLLGVVIAEGFIAVEAEDSAAVKDIGTAALALARALGVERADLLIESKGIRCRVGRGEAANTPWVRMRSRRISADCGAVFLRKARLLQPPDQRH